MLTYSQSTGELKTAAGELLGIGFSGFKGMKNSPASEDTPHGVIPRRLWSIFLPRPKDQSWTMNLQPNAPVARTALGTFSLQAGDASTISHGCIVMPAATIAKVVDLWNAGERQLQVIR